jgi:hypothetical protein
MTVEEFISNYDPRVQFIFLELRKITSEALPETEEIFFEGWKNISYGSGESRSDKDLILYIAPFKDSVNLGFFRGAQLPDKKNLLKGTGKLMRHLKIKSMSDYPLKDIKELILEAKEEKLNSR